MIMATQDISRKDVFAQKKSTCASSMTLDYTADIGTSADVYQLATLPPGCFITSASIVVITASDAATSATADLGLAGGDTLISGANLKSVAGTVVSGGTNAVVPQFLATGGILTIKPTYTGAATVGKFQVVVEYVEVDKTTGEYTRFV